VRKPALTIAEHLERGMAKAIEVGECVEWQGAFSCRGVTPVLKVRRPGARNSDNIAVCRELWERDKGPIPEGKLVYRTCCNNNCVNIDHLAVGTRKQWVAHRKRNGMTKHKQTTKLKMTVAARQRPNVVNTLEKARAVRALRGSMPNREIAKATGVSEAMVSDINAGSCWKEVISNPFAGLMG
jgi:hypothetical protein